MPRPLVVRPASSTIIAEIAYDPSTEVLDVELTSGNVYSYVEVPVETVRDFVRAKSAGRFFNNEIRTRFHHAT